MLNPNHWQCLKHFASLAIAHAITSVALFDWGGLYGKLQLQIACGWMLMKLHNCKQTHSQLSAQLVSSEKLMSLWVYMTTLGSTKAGSSEIFLRNQPLVEFAKSKYAALKTESMFKTPVENSVDSSPDESQMAAHVRKVSSQKSISWQMRSKSRL